MQALLELIATLLSTLASAGSLLGTHTTNILGATATLVRQGEAAVPVLSALTGHVESMTATALTQGAPTHGQVTALYETHLPAANALTTR